MGKLEIRVEPVERFFDRVRKVARRADQGKPISASNRGQCARLSQRQQLL